MGLGCVEIFEGMTPQTPCQLSLQFCCPLTKPGACAHYSTKCDVEQTTNAVYSYLSKTQFPAVLGTETNGPETDAVDR